MNTLHHIFGAHDLVGGDLAVDLANTVTARDQEPADWLDSYAALLQWAKEAGRFAKSDLKQLDDAARRAPTRASAALARCKALREAICAVLYAMAAGRKPGQDSITAIDKARIAASKAAKLMPRQSRLQIHWSAETSGLDLITHVVAAHAVELLKDDRLARLRVCGGTYCGWLFIDTSKSGLRRWCDMATCGNAAKARTFQQNRRKSTRPK